jgi:hypothetical protein
VTSPQAAARVLGRAVVVDGEPVGHVSGIFVDAVGARPIGLEVASTGRPARFLPSVAATQRGAAIVAASSLVLVDSCDQYVERGAVLCREQRELAALLDGWVSEVAAVGTARS